MAVSPAKTLWVREPYLSQILSGRKTIEVRVGYSNILRLRPGDQLRLNEKHLVTIRRISRYQDFDELLAREDAQAIAPDLPADELLAALQTIYPPDKESLGAVAIELALPRRYDAVLFDMGYTLIEFEPPQTVIVQRALQDMGVERSVDAIVAAVESVWGEYYRDAATETFPATEAYDRQIQQTLVQNLLAHLGLQSSSDMMQSYSNSIEAWFDRPGVVRTYPEARSVLGALRERDYRLGIVSNWSWNLRQRVAQVELESYFEVIWASAYAGCNKPHPAIFQQALAHMGPPEIAPHRTLYVGDSYQHDVLGARNAGLDVVLLDRDGRASVADCPVVHDLWGVLSLLGE